MLVQKKAAFIFSATLLLTLFLYNYDDISMVGYGVVMRVKNKREPIYLFTGDEDFLLNTTGCVIPNFGKNLTYTQAKIQKESCGERLVTLQKLDDNEIIFLIDEDDMKKHVQSNSYECCYKFAYRSDVNGKEDIELKFTTCQPFKNGTKIVHKEEVITVQCLAAKPKKKIFYEDSYMQIKKTQPITKSTKEKWNVLVLGMDTMSRARFFSDMPQLAKYIKNNGWLDYRGYNKAGDNTYPNLMALLTGMNVSSTYSACKPNMSACNEHMLWSQFHSAGYATAYGEDFLSLPDTFFKYNGFQSMPTDHYMRPLFLTGERTYGKHHLVCTNHLPSAKHIVDYAYDFVTTYKDDNFFGFFWINSYSHNEENIPSMFEDDVINLFQSIENSGVLNNTFIIFLSDHGVRFGHRRWPMESYYKVRMPMLLMRVPEGFRDLHEEEYYNLQLNQNRLVSPYDLHKTLVKISNMSVNSTHITSKGCKTCINLFEVASERRTCADAGVNDKWCTCHDMKLVDKNHDTDGASSVQVVLSYVQVKTRSVRTKKCWACETLELNEVLRTHSYTLEGKTYFVIAFAMRPGAVAYEGTVLKNSNNFTVLNGLDIITGYNALGSCVVHSLDRIWCVCKKVKCK